MSKIKRLAKLWITRYNLIVCWQFSDPLKMVSSSSMMMKPGLVSAVHFEWIHSTFEFEIKRKINIQLASPSQIIYLLKQCSKNTWKIVYNVAVDSMCLFFCRTKTNVRFEFGHEASFEWYALVGNWKQIRHRKNSSYFQHRINFQLIEITLFMYSCHHCYNTW